MFKGIMFPFACAVPGLIVTITLIFVDKQKRIYIMCTSPCLYIRPNWPNLVQRKSKELVFVSVSYYNKNVTTDYIKVSG